jgi:hypothetical protein
MKIFRSLLVLTVCSLAVLNSGCATSKPAAVQVAQVHPVSVADVEALAKAGMTDDLIISQITSSGTAYHLSAADIINLHNSGVSNRVIQCMITTAPAYAPTAVVAAPAPAPVYYYPAYEPVYPWWGWCPPVAFAFRFH